MLTLIRLYIGSLQEIQTLFDLNDLTNERTNDWMAIFNEDKHRSIIQMVDEGACITADYTAIGFAYEKCM
jgi:hypothetical protein